MSAQRRTRLWISGVLGVAAVAGLAAVVLLAPGRGRHDADAQSAQVIDEKTPIDLLADPLREGDGRALAVLFQRSAVKAGATVRPLSDEEAASWIGALAAIRAGYGRFGSYGRASAVTVVGRVLQRFAVEPAPNDWQAALLPAHDLLAAGLEDQNNDVRVAALNELTSVWAWLPGRTLTPAEEDAVNGFKEGFQAPVLRRLGDPSKNVRTMAIACLGRLPINSVASQAVAYLNDPEPEVRNQVLVAFAGRPGVLSEDAILKRVYDPESIIGETARTVLGMRGFDKEQISLGSMIFHPKPEIRVSVISLIKNRVDIDPVVWLLQLSHDPVETVRLSAVEALGTRLTPEVGQRLAEMAATDRSAEVRAAAGKFLPEIEKTVSLPPLPGTPRLNPKAN